MWCNSLGFLTLGMFVLDREKSLNGDQTQNNSQACGYSVATSLALQYCGKTWIPSLHRTAGFVQLVSAAFKAGDMHREY